MLLIYRIYLKMYQIIYKIHQQIVLNMSIKRGLKVGKGVIFIEVPQFGSEPYLIEIGDNTKITAGCVFINHDGGLYTVRSMQKYIDVRNFGRIRIGKNCFVGNNCIFLPGAQMNDNCILGAGSILNSTMPENTVYAGVPAKFICNIQDYGDKSLENNTLYNRELEKNRKKMDTYLKNNLAHKYKPVKMK